MCNAGKIYFTQITKARRIHCGFYKLKMKDDNKKNYFPNWQLILRRIHHGFYKLKMKDYNKKLFPQLAMDTEFFPYKWLNFFLANWPFVRKKFSINCQLGEIVFFLFLVDIKLKAQSERCAPYCAIGNWVLIANYCTKMGDTQIFSTNLRCASLFNDDLYNEPNFGRICLAGLYQ
jgi:hypothetical protein